MRDREEGKYYAESRFLAKARFVGGGEGSCVEVVSEGAIEYSVEDFRRRYEKIIGIGEESCVEVVPEGCTGAIVYSVTDFLRRFEKLDGEKIQMEEIKNGTELGCVNCRSGMRLFIHEDGVWKVIDGRRQMEIDDETFEKVFVEGKNRDTAEDIKGCSFKVDGSAGLLMVGESDKSYIEGNLEIVRTESGVEYRILDDIVIKRQLGEEFETMGELIEAIEKQPVWKDGRLIELFVVEDKKSGESYQVNVLEEYSLKVFK